MENTCLVTTAAEDTGDICSRWCWYVKASSGISPTGEKAALGDLEALPWGLEGWPSFHLASKQPKRQSPNHGRPFLSLHRLFHCFRVPVESGSHPVGLRVGRLAKVWWIFPANWNSIEWDGTSQPCLIAQGETWMRTTENYRSTKIDQFFPPVRNGRANFMMGTPNMNGPGRSCQYGELGFITPRQPHQKTAKTRFASLFFRGFLELFETTALKAS